MTQTAYCFRCEQLRHFAIIGNVKMDPAAVEELAGYSGRIVSIEFVGCDEERGVLPHMSRNVVPL